MNIETNAVEAPEVADESVLETKPITEEGGQEVEAKEAGEEESELEESTNSKEDAERKRHNGVQQRINELTRQRYEAEERNRALAEQLRQYQEHVQRQQAGQNFPRIEDYDFDSDKYSRAVAHWVQAGQEQAAKEQQRQQAEYQAHQNQIRQQTEIAAKAAKAVEKYPDFYAVINDPALPPLQEINPAAYQAVIESDSMGEVAYYLAKNPQEVYRFSSMSPVQAVKEVARLELMVNKPTATTKPQSKPTAVLGGKAPGAKDPEKMSTEEWLKWRNQQLSSR